ncbi:MAG: SPASM domain-containing protein [Planctomycetes bacterium]|nr:SPASM domain-containing protein [Planctomycetota bacterium]
MAKTQKYFLPEQYGLFERLKVQLFDGKRPIPAFPIRAQIQTRTACNAECSFCPNTTVGDALSQGTMEWDLFTKIVDEMCAHDMQEIHPFLMNEPLWDKDLPKKIRYIADKRRPGSDLKLKINTNASLLTDDMAKQLIESGLDKLNISFHGIRPEVYEFNMGNLKFEPMVKKVLRFKEMLDKASKPKPALHITMVKTKDIVADKKNIRAFWKSHGIGCNLRPLGNRNNKEVEMKGINWDDWHAYTWCRRPFTQIYILYNGDCVLCCCDWNRTTTLGNLRHKSIEEVWNSPAYKRVRENFLLKERKDLLCGTCLYTR